MITLVGGLTLWNPLGAGAGALGLIARDADGQPGLFVLSCYHVFFRLLTPASPGRLWGADEQILADGQELIAHGADETVPDELTVAILRADRPGDRALDCAAAEIVPGLACRPEILGLGPVKAPQDPAVGQRVRMFGAATAPIHGISEAVVSAFDPTSGAVEIAALTTGPTPARPARVGDSGSIWVDSATGSPVAMHLGSLDFPPYTCRARALSIVLMALKLRVWLGD